MSTFFSRKSGKNKIKNVGGKDYINDIVQKKRKELGAFEYGDSHCNRKVEKRPEQVIENQGKYDGEWLVGKDVRHGKGVLTWIDGSIYEGWFKHGKACEKGRMIHSGGEVYEGDWLGDKAHGFGKYMFIDGSTYEGEWSMNQHHGKGKEIRADGNNYEGFFAKDKRNGYGI